MLRVKESEVKQVTRSMKWRLTELNKGREISEYTFSVFNFFKRTRKKNPQFCPSMLKVVESKNKGSFDFIELIRGYLTK